MALTETTVFSSELDRPTWVDLDADSLFPEALDTLAEAAQGILDPVINVIDLAQDAINLAKVFLEDFPLFDVSGQLATLVENFKNDFLGGGLFYLPMWDYGIEQLRINEVLGSASVAARAQYTDDSLRKNIDRWVNTVNLSFDDSLDSQRPQLSDTADVVAVCFLVGAPSFAEFVDAYNEVVKLFPNESDVTRTRDRMREILEDIPEAPDTSRKGGYPDWVSASIGDLFPEVQELFDRGFDKLVRALRIGANTDDALSFLLNVLEQKVQTLKQIALDIDDIISRLDDVLGATGFHFLYISTSRGVTGFKQELRDSLNKPFDDFFSFMAGAVLLGGGPGASTMANFFGSGEGRLQEPATF